MLLGAEDNSLHLHLLRFGPCRTTSVETVFRRDAEHLGRCVLALLFPTIRRCGLILRP
jgi:hypothetical protein